MSARFVPLAAAILLLPACAKLDAISGTDTASAGTVQYRCSNDYPLTATFHKEPSRVLIAAEGRTVELPQVPAASGTRYEAEGVAFWIRGNDIFWNRSGEALLERAPGVSTRVCRPDTPPPPA